ncbi:MAG TPA: alkaline phosphatase family protein [Nitrososphaerales archaeon]|nr:alkaline phosphatase family protein [Nitrososphaerales archaeon]
MTCFLLLILPANNLVLAQSSSQTPIDHVIIITQENHSFDNYFGTFPTANGTLANSITTQLEGVNGIPNGVCVPYNGGCLSPQPAKNATVPDPNEGQLVYERDWNNGSMNGFAENSGPQSMIYFDYKQIPAYWDYAEEYGLADNDFAPVLSTTLPNRLMAIEGNSPFANTGDIKENTPGFIQNVTNQLTNSFTSTIFYQLSTSGVTWGYYDFLPNQATGNNGVLGSLNPANNVQNVSSFLNDLATGNDLPQVSFVNSLGANGLDELSPNNVTAGEQWTVSIVNAVMRSTYWGSSAIFITWDEGGGYYDHVAPPQVLTINHDFASPLIGYGQRLPLIVISPYAKEDYVSQTTLNTMSLAKFIEYDFDLPALNQNVASSNNLLDFFDFQQSPRAPLVLSSGGDYSYNTYPIPLQIPFDQLTYSHTGSYTGSESTQSGGTVQSTENQLVGIFTGTAQLVKELTSSKMSQITIHQILSLVYLVVIVAVVAVVVSVVGRVARNRGGKKRGAPPS